MLAASGAGRYNRDRPEPPEDAIMPRRASMLLTVSLLLSLLPLATASAQSDPTFAFEGVLPMVYELYDPVPPELFTPEGHVMNDEEISASFDVRRGDPVTIIRGGEIVGEGEVVGVVALKRADARDDEVVHLQITGLPEGVTLPPPPPGRDVLEDENYTLVVVTDKPVEVLAPDPVFQGHRFMTQDYVVRVGRTRYAVLREADPRGDGHRGWSVNRLRSDGTTRLMADYTWWAR
jgi:hypothetical protein